MHKKSCSDLMGPLVVFLYFVQAQSHSIVILLDLMLLTEWYRPGKMLGQEWNMVCQTDKCNIIYLTRKCTNFNFQYTLEDTVLQSDDILKYT